MRFLTAAAAAGLSLLSMPQLRAQTSTCFRYGVAGPIVEHPPRYGAKGVAVNCVTGMIKHQEARMALGAGATQANPPGGLLKAGQRIGPPPR